MLNHRIHLFGAAIGLACFATVLSVSLFWSERSSREPSVPPAGPDAPTSGFVAADNLRAEPGVVDPEDSISATAVLITSSGERIELESLDGEFERVGAEPGQTFFIGLRPLRFTMAEPVRIDADHGGSLDRRAGPIEAMRIRGNGELSFSYSVGGHRGRYTVEVSQGPHRELFEFWVGPEAPQGDPGPSRVFSGPASRG